MKQPIYVTALALAMVASPHAATAATLEAFAGVKITFANVDDPDEGFGAVNVFVGQSLDPVDETSGDGTTNGGATVIQSAILQVGQPTLTTSVRVDAGAVTTLDGEATFKNTYRQQFFVERSLVADRLITVTLAPLDGFLGRFLEVFGRSDSFGDIGSAFAAVTLEQTGVEGPLFFQSVFQSLAGLSPPDFVTEPKFLTPVTFDILIPQRNAGASAVRFDLFLDVETFALSQPADPGPHVAAIPLPPAAPLLALGLGCLALLRRRRGLRVGR